MAGTPSGAPSGGGRGGTCLLIATYPDHYQELARNLRSLREHSTDARLPDAHIVMDRIVDVQRDSSQFSKIWNDGGKGLLHAHSLQGLMRDVNEDASTDPIVRQLMEEARHRVCGSAARSAAAHLCSGFLQSSAFHNACQKRCLSGVQRPLATLPPLPDNATWTERFRQIAVSQNTVHNSAIRHTWPKLNSSACARDCTTLADIASRARDEMRPLGDSAAHDRFDFYATENKPFLVELGSPRHGLAPCTPAPPLGYYNFKRKYQILKKFYGAQHAYRVGGCGLLWLIDSESFAFRPFSFADDVFGRYAAQPTIFLGGPTSPTPAECHMRSLFANWGMDPERRAGARFVRALDLEPFHDDVWIWEGAIADDLLTSMRGSGSRSLAAVVLNSSSSYGTHHEQVAYYNWVLVQQQMHEGKYAHVQRRDVEKLAASRWPSLQLEKHLASLRDGVIRDAGGTHTMIGPSVGRLHAAMALGMAALNASTAQRLHLRREFISLLHENGWVFVRGTMPRPWIAVEDLMPDWKVALCINNCAVSQRQVTALGLPANPWHAMPADHSSKSAAEAERQREARVKVFDISLATLRAFQ